MNSKKTVFVITGIIISVSIAVGIISLYPSNSLVKQVPQASFNQSYNESAETMVVTFQDGESISSDDITLVQILVNNSTSGVRLHHNGFTSTDGIWVNTNQSGVARFPLEPGESVEIVSDSRDRDQDGIAGLEPRDTIQILIIKSNGESAVLSEIEL